MWGGRYRALVDGDEWDEVQGWVYEVQNKKQEDALRAYESKNYKVVRIGIQTDGGEVRGLTFRFCGEA